MNPGLLALAQLQSAAEKCPQVQRLAHFENTLLASSTPALHPRVTQWVKHNYGTARKKYTTNRLVGGIRKRHSGDALHIAKQRFIQKAKFKDSTFKPKPNDSSFSVMRRAAKINGISFWEWKRGREAQHLVPASLAMKYGWPDSDINSHENAMMLPEGNRPKGKGMHPNYIKRKKKKIAGGKPSLKLKNPKHIKKGVAHPKYNKLVGKKMKKNMTPKERVKLMKSLRTLHKKNSDGKHYVDDL